MPKETFFNLPDEKREMIVDIALEEFADKDYRAVSVSHLVARAGIAKGSFYQYFENKKDLYLYLLELGTREKAHFLRTTPLPDPAMGTFAYLRWLFEAGVAFEFSNPRLTRVAYRAFYEDVPFPDEAHSQAAAVSTQFFENLVRRGIAQGDLRPDLDVASAVFLFNLLILELGNHILQRLGIEPDELDEKGALLFDRADAAAIFSGFMDMLEHGMGARHSMGPSEGTKSE